MDELRVLIVDDEASARATVANLLRQAPDCNVAGEAESGEQALRLAKELRPNVMLVDVVMPGMDGLTLVSRLNRLYPEIQIVMLTMYSEFTYAVDAFRSGAVDYVLKDAYDAGPLLRALEKARSALRRQGEQELDARRAQIASQIRDKAWKGMNGRFLTLASTGEADPCTRQEAVFRALGGQSALAAAEEIWFAPEPCGEDDCPGVIWGKPVRDAGEEDLDRFIHSLGERFYLPELTALSGIVYDGALRQESYSRLQAEFTGFMQSKAPSFPGDYIAACLSDHVSPGEAISSLVGLVRSAGQGAERFREGIEQIRAARSARELELALRTLLLRAQLEGGPGESSQIALLKQYIEENPGADLSLNALSARVELSAAYLSALFKQETGEGLKRFVTRTRLNAAAELLRSSNLKIYEIAQRCGFPNVRYFSDLFSDWYGTTPQRYRRRDDGK